MSLQFVFNLIIAVIVGLVLLVVVLALAVALPLSVLVICVLWLQFVRATLETVTRSRLSGAPLVVTGLFAVFPVCLLGFGLLIGVPTALVLLALGLPQSAAVSDGVFAGGVVGALLSFSLSPLLVWQTYPFTGVPVNYNLQNLLVRWRTTSLTAVAFTLVVSLMTVMLAFVNGMYALTKNSGHPTNVIVMADGATDELFSNLGYGDVKEIELHPDVARDDEDGKPLASWEVYVVVNQPILVRKCPKCGQMAPVDRLGRKLETHGEPTCAGSGTEVTGTRGRRFLSVRGIEDPAKSGKVHELPLHEGGSWFTQAGVQPLPGSTSGEQAVQAVIGEGLARELGPDQGKKSLVVGDHFELGPRKWVIVGILKSAGSTFDSEVWGKFSLVSQLFGKATYTTCVLRTETPEKATSLAKDLAANYKKPAVAAQTEPEYFERLNTTNQQFLYAIAGMVLIMGIGSIFGVMNTMFAAISQRTKDVGVLRIIGYARWQVLTSFFMESLALALIGGAIGCALGSLCHGYSASSIMSSGVGGGKSVILRMVVDWRIIATGMGFSLFMGCVGGLLPALSAMRLKALDSLR